MSRVFAWLKHGSTGEIRIYDFNETMGAFSEVGSPMTSIAQIPEFSSSMPRAFRVRAVELDPQTGKSDVYFCTSTFLVQMRWDPTVDENVLEYVSHWNTVQADALQDCRLYLMPQLDPLNKLLLTVKNSEGFAVIRPAQ